MILETKSGPVEIGDSTLVALADRYRVPLGTMLDELRKMHLWLLRHESRRPVRVWVFMDHWMKKVRGTQESRPRKVNIEELTGRSQEHGAESGRGNTYGVGGEVVRTVSGDVWESNHSDVGRLPSGRH